jgi:hypothetical protein
MSSIDEEWLEFINASMNGMSIHNDPIPSSSKPVQKIESNELKVKKNETAPECDELYISTKTKVLFLNQEIDINTIFWNIPMIKFWEMKNGVIKKQMKIVSKTVEEYQELQEKLKNVEYYKENIIKQINNPNARRLKFKDERKITIGISKKDITNVRGKIKGAFYNCFAIALRYYFIDSYKEIHVKIFNTGKLEIPGILNAQMLDIIKEMILELLQSFLKKPIEFLETNTEDNVLINSNFNCGYYINRDKLYSILRSDKYGVECAYDPCSYPGVKCKFYFNNEVGFDRELQNGKILLEDRNMKMTELTDNKKYTEVNFMIFRTGSGLVVGNFSEKILRFVFEFIKNILTTEYYLISVSNEVPMKKKKTLRIKKKVILVDE